jgi:hypothetical protein
MFGVGNVMFLGMKDRYVKNSTSEVEILENVLIAIVGFRKKVAAII